ncbi:MAG: SpoIIE family protein phosphatase [Bacteroidales bacterium]|nr:SpoIIE family protein phosphatase [Bacteroidales bacterium]
MYRLYLLLVFILISKFALPQEYLPVERFTAESGLSDDEVNCIFQDNTGFLWIGTRSGLNCYNGYNFDRFQADLSNHAALPSSNILKIFEDDNQQIWVLTAQGLSRFDHNKQTFKTFYVPSDTKDQPRIRLLDAELDVDHNRIFLLGSHAVYSLKLSSGQVRRLEISGLEEQLRALPPERLFYDQVGNSCYIVSGDKLFRIKPDEDLSGPVQIEESSLLVQEGGIAGMAFGADGQTWLYTGHSLWRMNEKNVFVRHSSVLQENTQKIIRVDQPDSTGLQVLTSSSLLSYDLKTKKSLQIFSYKIPGMEVVINDFLRIRENIFWLCTSDGLYQFNEYGNSFNEGDMSQWSGDSKTVVKAMNYDRNDKLWIGTGSGQLFLSDTKGRVLAKGSVGGAILDLQNPYVSDTALISTSAGIFLARKNKGDISFRKLFAGKVDALESISTDSVIFISKDSLHLISVSGKFRHNTRKIASLGDAPVLDILIQSGEIFLLQAHQLVCCSLSDTLVSMLNLTKNGLSTLPVNTCFFPSSPREIIVGTNVGLFIFYPNEPNVLPSFISLKLDNQYVQAIFQDAGKHIWFSTRKGLYEYDRPNSRLLSYSHRDGLSFPGQGFKRACSKSSGEICFYTDRFRAEFHPDSVKRNLYPPRLDIPKVEIISGTGITRQFIGDRDTLRVNSRFTMLRVHCTVLDYWDPKMNHYQYCFVSKGEPETWKNMSGNRIIDIPRLSTGTYILKVRGSNSSYVFSESSRDLVILVEASFWRSKTAVAMYVIVFFLSIYFLIFFTTRQLRKLNKEYREKEAIAKKVEQQKEELTQKNKNITDSINYAKRIQMALMPSERLFYKYFRDSFILHIPKDIVSGDFYWVNQVDGRIYFAAVDCTGHGVPGAFMSIIGFELFRRITEIEKKKQPAEILNSLSQGFETIFRDIEDITLRDGMDVAFCAIDPEMKVLEFAGAFNPLYLVRDNTISEVKGDRFSVGLNQTEEGSTHQEFRDHVINLKEGDIIYIFTDGYADQFGGPEGKKYKYRRFRHLLLALHQLPMDRQLEFLRRSIMDWKGDLDQVDDILVMGIRISQSGKK